MEICDREIAACMQVRREKRKEEGEPDDEGVKLTI
jgi:hypothetical protein